GAAERRRLARLAGLGRAALAQAGAPGRHAARALHDRGGDPLAQQARSRRAQDVHGDGEPARRGRADDARARDVRPPAPRLMRAAAALAALLVLVPSTAAAAARAIVLTTLFGEYHLVFDDARITEAEVRDLVVLSPHLAGWTSLAVAPRLERCVAGDSAYLDCARSTEPSRFLWNARVNLDAGAAAARRLAALRTPAELEPVAAWLRR